MKQTNSKPKILYVHHAIGLGGAPRSLAFLMAGLDRAEFEPIVAMPKRNGSQPVRQLFLDANVTLVEEQDLRPFHGSTVAPCDSWKDRAYALLSYNKTVACGKQLVARIRPDIVHLNSTCLVGAGKGAHLVAPDLPVIAHVREPLLQNRWGRMLARMNCRHVDRFIAIDQFGLDSLGDNVSGSVIYNFVDFENFNPDPPTAQATRRTHGWTDEQVVFLSLSRVSKSNGALELAKLIQANESLLPPAARFVVAGFDNQLSDYAAQAKQILESSPRCQVLPFVENVTQLIDASDVMIAPFVTPHSARSVFEGAAMGKPALVSKLPNLTELIVEQETGAVFDWQVPATFVDQIRRMCDNQTRQTWGHAAREHAWKNFNAQRNIEKTMQVYREVLNP